MLGDAVFLASISFAVLDVTGSPAALGIVLGVGTAAMVVALLFSGVWADRLPRLQVMVASDLLRLVSQAILATLLLTDNANLTSLVVLNATQSIGMAFFTPARTALVSQLLHPGLLVAGNSLIVSAANLLGIIGLAGGGLLVAAVTPGGAIAIDAVTFLVSALLLLSIGSLPLPESDEERQPFLRELAIGWREVISRRWLWIIVLNAALFLMLFEGPLQVVGPITMQEVYEGPISWGLVGAALSLGMVIGAMWLAGWKRLRRPFFLSLVLFFTTVGIPLLMLWEVPFGWLLAWYVVVGLGFGMFDTLWHAAIQKVVPADRIARVSAWDWMGSYAGMPIGFIIAGFTTEHVGREGTLIGMAVGVFVVCVALIVSKDVRSLDDALRESDAPTPHSA
ncbi:MAG: yfiS-like MFS-type transporter [Thermoleophilia bacterium]|nr:yfiS-like MFS-type transporter [Thermoleophilia bacterium]